MGSRIPWRRSGGQFTRPPGLDTLGIAQVCTGIPGGAWCGRFLVNSSPDPASPTYPSTCPSCGAVIDPKTGKPPDGPPGPWTPTADGRSWFRTYPNGSRAADVGPAPLGWMAHRPDGVPIALGNQSGDLGRHLADAALLSADVPVPDPAPPPAAPAGSERQ